MSRLSRPHIPLHVREMVLDRQMREVGFKPSWASRQGRSVATRLRLKLEEFFGCAPVELHHQPALVNRQYLGAGLYSPLANDPNYLVYLTADDHDIETRVRGQHGQYSDLAMARKRKRKERKAMRPKRKWPSRRLAG
jgi:hypothetical protein